MKKQLVISKYQIPKVRNVRDVVQTVLSTLRRTIGQIPSHKNIFSFEYFVFAMFAFYVIHVTLIFSQNYIFS